MKVTSDNAHVGCLPDYLAVNFQLCVRIAGAVVAAMYVLPDHTGHILTFADWKWLIQFLEAVMDCRCQRTCDSLGIKVRSDDAPGFTPKFDFRH